jgi:hypothetical protein
LCVVGEGVWEKFEVFGGSFLKKFDRKALEVTGIM